MEGETCVGKQADGSCTLVYIPDCEDRNVYCNPLKTPGNATRFKKARPFFKYEWYGIYCIVVQLFGEVVIDQKDWIKLLTSIAA